uniref:Uncharacterized protein n=1 Tax=Peronospora matthiolae TaxID=2874970 RepID=A0AAV1VBM0_9STRA
MKKSVEKMSSAWRVARAGIRKARIQHSQVLLLIPWQMSLLACGWEFVAEVSRTGDIAGPLQLILPQLALLAVIGIQFFPAVDVRYRKYIDGMVMLLVPLFGVTIVHSCFRMGISLCCCCRSLCPVANSAEVKPDTTACGLVVSNCYMAFIRKVAHFYGIVSSMETLAATMVGRLAITSRQSSAFSIFTDFLFKTRL